MKSERSEHPRYPHHYSHIPCHGGLPPQQEKPPPEGPSHLFGIGLATIIIILLIISLLSGCGACLGNAKAEEPIEKGCTYIACAIVTHGVLQVFWRK